MPLPGLRPLIPHVPCASLRRWRDRGFYTTSTPSRRRLRTPRTRGDGALARFLPAVFALNFLLLSVASAVHVWTQIWTRPIFLLHFNTSRRRDMSPLRPQILPRPSFDALPHDDEADVPFFILHLLEGHGVAVRERLERVLAGRVNLHILS